LQRTFAAPLDAVRCRDFISFRRLASPA
jgi:hypothetical protein